MAKDVSEWDGILRKKLQKSLNRKMRKGKSPKNRNPIKRIKPCSHKKNVGVYNWEGEIGIAVGQLLFSEGNGGILFSYTVGSEEAMLNYKTFIDINIPKKTSSVTIAPGGDRGVGTFFSHD